MGAATEEGVGWELGRGTLGWAPAEVGITAAPDADRSGIGCGIVPEEAELISTCNWLLILINVVTLAPALAIREPIFLTYETTIPGPAVI